MLDMAGPALAFSPLETLAFRYCFGEDETVVTVVVAVCGRSVDPLEAACADVAGIFPDSSILLILDFKSSSSSQTVEGGGPESTESVPSAREYARLLVGSGVFG
jgi:hypothetical protein